MRFALALALLLCLASADLITTLDRLPVNIADEADQRIGQYAADAAFAAYKVNYNLLMTPPESTADESSGLAGTVAGVVTMMATFALAYFGLNYMMKASGAPREM